MAIMQQCPECRRRQRVTLKRCLACGRDLDKAKRSNLVVYWITYRLPGGKQRFESIGTSIEEAKDAEGKRRAQKREGRIFEMLPDSKKTFIELAEWFEDLEKTKSLSYYVGIKSHLKLFNTALGNRLVNDIQPSDIENLQLKLRDEGYSASYSDQVVKSVKTMLTRALDNDLVGGDLLRPFRKVKAVLKRGSNARQRVLTPDEFRRLRDSCPAHVRGIVGMGFWTGMRLGEILPLTWDQVDLSDRMIRLGAEHTKEGMPKSVPMPKCVRDMLLTLPDRAKNDAVFTYRHGSLSTIIDALKRGCKAAKIAYGQKAKGGFVFHDLRHTFTTNARRAGVPRNVIMAIMGHSTGGDMHARYDKIEDSDLIEAIDRIEKMFSASVDQNVDQGAKSGR